jgi:hypothetical protein
MRSKFLLGLVVMMLMAVPAMAAPISITFTGSAAGFLDLADVDVDYSITFGADTANLLSGTFVSTGQSVDYYAALNATVTLAYYDLVTGLPTGVVDTFTTDPTLNTFYVAQSPAQTVGTVAYPPTFAYGIWDPALFSDPNLGLGFDGISLDTSGTGMGSSFIKYGGQSFTEYNFMLAIGMIFTTGQELGLESPTIGMIPNPAYPHDPINEPLEIPGQLPITISATAVPEPSMFLLFGAGLLGLGMLRKK